MVNRVRIIRPTLPPAERLLIAPEVGALFGVESQTVTKWANLGWMPSILTPGGHRRYREREVRDLLQSRRDGAE